MPRQANNNSSNRRSFSNTTPTIYDRKISSTPTPQTYSHQTVEHQGPGIWGSMKQGIGLGMGSEMGHRIMNSVLGPPAHNQQQTTYKEAQHLPPAHQNLYAQCIEKNQDFKEICKPFLTKDSSSWKLCMETAQFNHLKCTD
jgi:membrane protease subunit (stomatin/prohibitin family)